MTRYRIELEARPTAADADRRLAMGLKYLLRSCGLKCVHVEEVKLEGEPTPAGEGVEQ